MEQNHIETYDSLYLNDITYEGDFFDIAYSNGYTKPLLKVHQLIEHNNHLQGLKVPKHFFGNHQNKN